MRALLASAACLLAVLALTEQAAACSCAGPERPPSLEGEDAAVTARLLEVKRDPAPGFFDHLFTYKVRRVFKGRHEYGLHHGVRVRIRTTTGGAGCGLPTRRERVYALILYESRRELHANLCTMVSRKYLRKAARNRDSERLAHERPSRGSIAPSEGRSRRGGRVLELEPSRRGCAERAAGASS
jgi:hypothetical protein